MSLEYEECLTEARQGQGLTIAIATRMLPKGRDVVSANESAAGFRHD
jgi:hypothetical protein